MNNLSVKKINDIVVKPVKGTEDKRPYKYSELFDEPYFNLFLCAKKKSGKTTTIATILKYCATPLTTIRLFSSTYRNDSVMTRTIQKFREKGFIVETYDNLKCNDPKYVDILDKHIAELNEFIDKNKDLLLSYDNRFPLVIYIFDDFRQYLRNNKNIGTLSTFTRHFRAILLYSSQGYMDIEPIVRENLNYLLLFKGVGEDRLEEIYKEEVKDLSYDQFKEYYNTATNAKFNFLYYNLNNQKDIRINFNYRFDN